MNKKTIFFLGLALGAVIVAAKLIFFSSQQNSPLFTPTVQKESTRQILPSETLKVYQDPSGFTFSYPDNLSLTNNEAEDISTYADIQLSSKEVNGSLALKISDSKFRSIDEWVKINKNDSSPTPKEVKLGNLKATEITTNDRLLLGALDQGIFFTIEMPLVEKDFWMKVYNKVLADFSFAPPSPDSITSQSAGVTFEGEETVE